ncbi:MAG: tetratricopeptide repeat protein, partial [Promethearchaeota archaeon]
TFNISDPHQRETEVNKIEKAKKKPQLLLIINKSENLCQENQFDEALNHLNEALNTAVNILDPEDEVIEMIKSNITRAYSEKIKLIIEEGDEAKQNSQYEEAIKIYNKGFDVVKNMQDTIEKDKNKEIIENKINISLSEEINLVIQHGKNLLAENKPKETENELNKSLNLIDRMYESDLKEMKLGNIAELLNPIHIENSKSFIDEAFQITNQEGYEKSIMDVNKAIEKLNQALKIINKMAESKQKFEEIDKLTNLINDICAKAIEPRKKRGNELIEKKQFDEAIRELYSAVSIAKNLVYPEGEENEELNEMKKIINKVYLAEAEDILSRGFILIEENKLNEALDTFNEALSVTNKMYLSEEMDKEVSKIKNAIYQTELKQIVTKGDLSEEEKKLEKEIERLNQLLQASNNISDPEQKTQKMDDIRREIDNVHVERITLLIEQANKLTEQNKFDIAFNNFERCISIAEFIYFSKIKENELAKIIDNYIIELNNKARQEILNENFEKVLELCNKAIELDETYVESYYNLGNMYKYRNNMEKAIEYYQKSIGLDPNHSNAFNDLGLIYEENGELDKAIDSYKKAIEVDSRHSRAWCNLGNVYKSKNEYEQALHAYNKAIEIDPKYAEAWFLLGKVNFSKKEFNLAIEHLEKAIGLKPELGRTVTPLINEFKSIIASFKEKLS